MDDVYGGTPPARNAEMPRRFTAYLRWTWPLWFAATLTVGALWPRTADYGWLLAGVVWFLVGWGTAYQMDRVEWRARNPLGGLDAKRGRAPRKEPAPKPSLPAA